MDLDFGTDFGTRISDKLGKLSKTHGFLEKIAVTDGFLEFEWKIPDFLSREEKHNYRVQSPKFKFFDAECIIHMKLEITNYYIDLVCNVKDIDLVLPSNYSIELICYDGTVYKSVRGAIEMRNCIRIAIPGLVSSRSALLQDRTKIAPSDILTVFCSLSVDKKHFKKTVADSAIQTQISEGIHASTQVIEKYLGGSEDEESNGKKPLSDVAGFYKLSEDLKGLLLSGAHCDTTIKISDREFRAHRAILGARSSVFQSMFSDDTTERNTGMIEIEDCDPHAFQDFLVFLYSGKVEKLCSENVLHLYALTDKYDVQQMKIECLTFMTHNFSVDTFCDVVSLALRHNETELLETATDFFKKKY